MLLRSQPLEYLMVFFRTHSEAGTGYTYLRTCLGVDRIFFHLSCTHICVHALKLHEHEMTGGVRMCVCAGWLEMKNNAEGVNPKRTLN